MSITVRDFDVINVKLHEMIYIQQPVQHKKVPIRYLNDTNVEQPLILNLPKMKACVYEHRNTKQ